MIQALVLTGYGINCEKEMAVACEMAGAQVFTAHVEGLLSREISLDRYQLLIIPGGFSFGDELGAGKAFANRLNYAAEVKEQLEVFVAKGKCILGVCNGFQLLVKLGLLSGGSGQELSLTHNDSSRFINKWCHHEVPSTPCVFTKGLTNLYLPIRHAEGKLVVRSDDVHERLIEQNQIALKYCADENPNGSLDNIAGLCDTTGRILGMMPHPEAAVRQLQHPHWTRLKEREGPGEGLKIFTNVINYLEEAL